MRRGDGANAARVVPVEQIRGRLRPFLWETTHVAIRKSLELRWVFVRASNKHQGRKRFCPSFLLHRVKQSRWLSGDLSCGDRGTPRLTEREARRRPGGFDSWILSKHL